ncbi:MAG: hypothetical protein JKY12_08625 [Sneathiella sp.]|nr:hypothetical protein [Sneathiella sp.]
MTKFLLAYRGGHHFKTKKEGAAHMVKWQAWIAGLGDAVVDPGMPVGQSKTVSSNGVADDGGPNPLSGITILQAETMEEVLAMAKSCPHVDTSGTIEVAQTMEM